MSSPADTDADAAALERDQRALRTLHQQFQDERQRVFLLWMQAVNLLLGSIVCVALAVYLATTETAKQIVLALLAKPAAMSMPAALRAAPPAPPAPPAAK